MFSPVKYYNHQTAFMWSSFYVFLNKISDEREAVFAEVFCISFAVYEKTLYSNLREDQAKGKMSEIIYVNSVD